MKSRKREGIVRRPVEYVLLAILVLVIGVAAWTGLALRRANDQAMTAESTQGPERPLEGTIDELDWLAEYDIREERLVDAVQRTRDQQISKQLDAAADNIGSAVDENAIPMDICTEASAYTGRIQAAFGELQAAYDQARTRQDQTRAEQLSESAAKIAASRAQRDVERSNSFELLSERTSEANGALAAAFRERADGIIAQRRSEFDAARAAYAAEVDTLIAARRTAVEQAGAAFRDAVVQALAAAKQACSRRGADGSAIKQELARVTHQSRLAYAEVLRARQDMQAAVRTAETHKAGQYDTAITTFEQALKSLQAEYQDLRR